MSDGMMDTKGYAIYDTYLKRVYFAHTKREKDLFINDKARSGNNYTVSKVDLEIDDIPMLLENHLKEGYLVELNGRIVTPSEEDEYFSFPDDMSALYTDLDNIIFDVCRLKLKDDELDLIMSTIKKYKEFVNGIRDEYYESDVPMCELDKFNLNEVLNRVIEFSNNRDIRDQMAGTTRW